MAEKMLKKRFNFPQGDNVTKEWFEAQSSPHISLRLLVRHYVQEHGMTDVLFGFGLENTISDKRYIEKEKVEPKKVDAIIPSVERVVEPKVEGVQSRRVGVDRPYVQSVQQPMVQSNANHDVAMDDEQPDMDAIFGR